MSEICTRQHLAQLWVPVAWFEPSVTGVMMVNGRPCSFPVTFLLTNTKPEFHSTNSMPLPRAMMMRSSFNTMAF